MSCSMDFILVFFSWFAFKFVSQVNEVLLEVIFNLRMFKSVIDRRFHESEFVVIAPQGKGENGRYSVETFVEKPNPFP